MRRKYRIGLAAVCLICAVLAGCGAEAQPKKEEPTAVIVWHYYNGKQKDAFEQLVIRFNETVGMEKNILVSAESKGNVDELATAVIESVEKKVGADEPPNIFATYMDTALVLHEMDILCDISRYMTQEEQASYVPAFLEEGKLEEGGLQALPVAKSTELFYLNATDWQEFARETGAEESAFDTWEGLAQVAEQYYEWSGGKAFFGRDAFPNYLIVGSRQLGKPIFEVQDNEVTIQLDEEAMRRLWECYAVPYLKGYYGAYGRFRSDDVKTGDLIACVASTSSVTYYPLEVTREDGTTYPIEVEVYDLPDFEGTSPYAVQQGAGMAVIRSNEEQERAAVEFLSWFTDVEQNSTFSVESGYFPVKQAANEQANIEKSLENAGMEAGSLMYDNLLMSAKAVEESTMYTSKAFRNGVDARAVLTAALSDKLDAYLEELNAMIAGGMERDQAWEAYITEELFQDWLRDLRVSLEAVL